MRKCYYSSKSKFKSYLRISRRVACFCRAQHCFTGSVILYPKLILAVVCRTIYLHCQICWNLRVTSIALTILNIVGWLIPAILLGVVFAVAQITYTISNHCSIRVDWVVDLLIIPIIIEMSCAAVMQLATFLYCVHVYLRSLSEPSPPTDDSFGNGAATSNYSIGSSRYPYRKAMARVNQVETLLPLLICRLSSCNGVLGRSAFRWFSSVHYFQWHTMSWPQSTSLCRIVYWLEKLSMEK